MKVTGFGDIEMFRQFTLEKAENHHDRCTFSAMVKEFSDYRDMINTTVKVIDEERYLMTGKVQSIDCIKGGTENIITVTICSDSIEHDRVVHTRIFQKRGQTYKDIVKNISEKLGVDTKINKSLSEKEVEGAIVQLKETDYEFLIRMAAEGFEASLIVDSTRENGTMYTIGKSEEQKDIKTEEIYAVKECKSINDTTIEMEISGESECQELRKFIDVGKMVNWNNKVYIISKVIVEKINGVYRYKCECRQKDVFDLRRNRQNTLTRFQAKVADNEDPENMGRVCLDFTSSEDKIEDMTNDQKMWFDVWTPYSAKTGGMVFIPDKDDTVDVLWDESKFYIVGCRRIQPLDQRYKNVNLKQIGNLFDKNICFSEEYLSISAKNTQIKISDETIEISVPNTKLTITGDKISIDTEKSNVIIDKDIQIDTDKVHIDADELENNIKSKYRCESKSIGINASKDVKIEGKNKVSIN